MDADSETSPDSILQCLTTLWFKKVSGHLVPLLSTIQVFLLLKQDVLQKDLSRTLGFVISLISEDEGILCISFS